jgi:type II secretory pathway pseudopilin PulG
LLYLLILIVVLAFGGVLAWPTIRYGMTKREMTRTMKNARALYLAAFQMASDGATKGDPDSAWPGDYPSADLADYCAKLIEKGYLKPADLEEMLSGAGMKCTVQITGDPKKPVVTLSGPSVLKIYRVKSTDPSNTIFAASSNYVYGTPLNPAAKPFGDVGFVVVRKSGDSGVYKKGQATQAGYENDPAKFRSEPGVGALPGAPAGSVVPGDGVMVLTGPQTR